MNLASYSILCNKDSYRNSMETGVWGRKVEGGIRKAEVGYLSIAVMGFAISDYWLEGVEGVHCNDPRFSYADILLSMAGLISIGNIRDQVYVWLFKILFSILLSRSLNFRSFCNFVFTRKTTLLTELYRFNPKPAPVFISGSERMVRIK